jgi:dihydropteroate synthase
MAVVNLTPDSFSDGGRFLAPERDDPNVSVVLRQCARWAEQGAHLLDLGGESTRPGATPVLADVELRRVAPVLARILADPATAPLPVSVDTRHASVARALLAGGAAIVNDISGLSDPDMAAAVAEHGAGLVLGHLRGEPRTMQREIRFSDLLGEVGDELAAAVDRAVAAGVDRDQIVVDPGIGFGKTPEQSAALAAAGELLEERTGRPVLVGVSRKSFLERITGRPVEQRALASVAAGLCAIMHGARILRVHDVAETVEALAVVAAIERSFVEHHGGPA